MINGDMVVAQTLQGATPPTWHVLRAKASFFYQQIGLAIIVLALGVGGFVALTGDPTSAYGYGISGSVSDSVFTFWRTVDFVAVAAIALTSAYLLVKNVLDIPRAKEQVLVLMPEGFVINSNKRAAYAYATMRTLKVTINRGTVSLKIQPANGAKAYSVTIDGRFDKPKQIAQQIATARNQLAAAQVAAQYPQQPPAQYPNPQR